MGNISRYTVRLKLPARQGSIVIVAYPLSRLNTRMALASGEVLKANALKRHAGVCKSRDPASIYRCFGNRILEVWTAVSLVKYRSVRDQLPEVRTAPRNSRPSPHSVDSLSYRVEPTIVPETQNQARMFNYTLEGAIHLRYYDQLAVVRNTSSI